MTELEPTNGPLGDDALSDLLRDARATDPMPAEVVARLDDVLAGLVSERASTDQASTDQASTDPAEGGVVPLRRRSWNSRLLVAAAAVVLVGGAGIGVQQAVSGSHDTLSASRPADHSASQKAPEASALPQPMLGAVPQAPAATTDSRHPEPGAANGGGVLDSTVTAAGQPYSSALVFTAAQFPAQAANYLRASRVLLSSTKTTGGIAPTETAPGTPTSGGTAEGSTTPNSFSGTNAPGSACPGPQPTDGSLVLPIRFGKHPAVLIVHPVVDGSRFVVAWSCDGRRVFAFTTVRG